MTLTIRLAFGLEAAANIFGAGMMLYSPSSILSYAHWHSSEPAPLASSLLQWIAALIIGLTPQLLIGLRSTPQAILSRRTVYWTLLTGEGALVAVMWWQGMKFKAATGFKKEALQLCAGVLLLTAVWRVFVLFVRPDLLGEDEAYEEVVREEKEAMGKKTE